MARPPLSEIQDQIRLRMQQRQMAPAVIEEYQRRAALVFHGATGKVDWNSIGDLQARDYVELEHLPAPGPDEVREDLSKLAVIKLNGGLGTTMGLTRAKSLIRVKGEYTFLEIIRKQILSLRAHFGVNLPLLFMNSFATREDTLREPGISEINRSVPGDIPPDFIQSMAPRIDAQTLLPVGDGSDESHWCPPGHGDVFLSLAITGILDRLLGAGYRTAFLSNGDNLGATVDPRLLRYFHANELQWVSETTPKTNVDLKGGVLYRKKAEHAPIELLETAQVPAERLPDFQNISRFGYFNINNLWVDLQALKDRLSGGALELALIVNPKRLGDQEILQLETAMGAAIGRFDRSRVMIVNRKRFAPVKDCADLLVRRSDCYTLHPDSWALERNPARSIAAEPIVSLDPVYKSVHDFESLTPFAPSLADCESLSVQGRIEFDQPTTMRGKVKLQAGPQGSRISAAGRSEFADETVTLP
ncbi:MAG: UTP--glucose-1-phosphate uridylyltransferase [Leptospirales bacterium]|nr:UTP--glucose-1-phosphate uridylyltransferase [Leptospirales bacterium]